jgi:hypothetical protein
MNLTHEHAAESRYAEAVFVELHALLTAAGGGGAVKVLDIHRAPGPVNSTFAIAMEVQVGRQLYSEVFSLTRWKDLPDASPAAMARAVAEDVRAQLNSYPEPSDGGGGRRWFRRR